MIDAISKQNTQNFRSVNLKSSNVSFVSDAPKKPNYSSEEQKTINHRALNGGLSAGVLASILGFFGDYFVDMLNHIDNILFGNSNETRESIFEGKFKFKEKAGVAIIAGSMCAVIGAVATKFMAQRDIKLAHIKNNTQDNSKETAF